MIALNFQEILGHYAVPNVTKFQNCRSNNKDFINENQSENLLKRIIYNLELTCS